MSKNNHRHLYEFRLGVMKSPACQICGNPPHTTRIKLTEPKGKIAALTHDSCPTDCSCEKNCPTMQWEIK